MLIAAANTYNQNQVPYNPAPDTWFSAFGGANSTGGAFGLIESQGGSLPDTSYILGGLGTEAAESPPPLVNYGGMCYDYPNTDYSSPLFDVYFGGK